MMRILFAALLVSMLVLMGCAADKAEPASGEPGPENALQEQAYAPPPPPSTAGIMLERTADDVMTDIAEPPQREVFNFSDATDGDGRVIVYYFFSSGCSACKALRGDIDRLEAECQGADWREYDLKNQSGSWAYLDFATQNNLSRQERLVPQVLVNGSIITDRFKINESLGGILAAFGACQAPS